MKGIGEMEKRAVNRPVSDLSRTAEKEIIDVITNHYAIRRRALNERQHPPPRRPRPGSPRLMYMDITCSNCGSNKVIRAGACGCCTECGTSQGCS